MALSDRFRFSVGDRVRDRQTSEEGRILQIRALADTALLLTVGIFVGGILRKKIDTRVIPGQRSGARFERIIESVLSGRGEITHPLQGGTVSARAIARATADEPAARSMTHVIKAQLDAASNRLSLLSASDDTEIVADALSRQINQLKRVQEAVFRKAGQRRQLLDFLSAKSIPIGEGDARVWSASYLSDLVYNRRRASTGSLAKGEQIERILARTRIPAELVQQHGELIPAGVQNSYDLLLHARKQIHALGWREGRALWQRYAEILRSSVELSPAGRNITRAIENLPQQINELYSQRRDVLSALGSERFQPGLGSTDIADLQGARTSEQVDIRDNSLTQGYTGQRFLDRADLARELGRKKAASIRTRSGIGRLGAGIDPATLKDRIGADPQAFFKNPAQHLGKVVQYTPAADQLASPVRRFGRAPYLISSIDPETRQVVLRPITTEIALYTSNALASPDQVAGLLRGKGRPIPQATPGTIAGRSVRAAQSLVETGTINIAGGLRGKGTQAVPLRLLRAYMMGDVPATESGLERLLFGEALPGRDRTRLLGELRRFGFQNESEFAQVSKAIRGQFESLIKQTLPKEQLSLLYRDVEDEDIISHLHTQMLQSFADLPGGLSMGEVQQQLAELVRGRVGAALGAERRGSEMSQRTKAFTQLELPKHLEEILEKEGEEFNSEEVADLLARGRPLPLDAAENAFQTVRELSLEVRSFRNQVARGRSRVEAFQEIFGDLTRGDTSRAFDVRALADEAVAIAENIDRFGLGDRYSIVPLRRFAGKLGFQTFDTTPEMERAWRSYRAGVKQFGERDPRTVQLASQYAELRQTEVQSVLERRFRQKLGLSPTPAADAVPPLPTQDFRLDLFNRGELAPKLNALIREAEESSDLSRINQLGFDPILLARGEVGIKLYPGNNRTGDPFIYRPTGAETGVATSFKDAAISIPFGGNEPITLSEEELAAARLSGRFRPIEAKIEREGEKVALTEAHLPRLQRQAIENASRLQALGEAIRPGGNTLPIFRTGEGSPLIGLATDAPVDAASVIERTRQFLENPGKFLSLDIETDPNTNTIQNLTIRAYEAREGQAVPLGPNYDVAQPSWWAKQQKWDPEAKGGAGDWIGDPNPERIRSLEQALAEGRALTPEERTIMRFGRNAEIANVVRSEREILEGAAAFLQQHSDLPIAGQNVAFDPKVLLERARSLGVEEEAFTGIASRVFDVMVASQALRPGERVGLQEVGLRELGITERQAHIAGPDVELTAQIAAHYTREGQTAAEILGRAEQVSMGEGQLLWDLEQRKAFRLAGMLDPERAREIFKLQTGGDLGNAGVGLALQEIDAVSKQAAGPLQVHTAYAPHTLAREFFGKFQIIGEEEAAARIETTTEDLARRALRRTISDPEAFTNVLKEQLRSELGQAAVGEPGALEAARLGMLGRSQAARSPVEQMLLKKTYGWSSTQMTPSRIRQLQLEQEYLAREVEGAHKPIVDWLREFVQQAPTEGAKGALDQANRLWSEYLKETEAISPFAQLTNYTIEPAQRKLSLQIPALGEKPKRLRIGSEAALQRDLDRITQGIARKLTADQPEEVSRFFESNEAFLKFAEAQKGQKTALESLVPQALQEEIWSRHIRPAIDQHDLLNIASPTRAGAIPEILGQGDEFAARMVAKLTDPLQPRQFDPGALRTLQQRFISRSPLEALRDIEGQSPFTFELRHGVPRHFLGRPVQEVLEAGKSLEGDDLARFQSTLRGAASRMAGVEQEQLRGILDPRWAGKVFGDPEPAAKTAERVFAEAGGAVSRKFRPGLLNAAGLDLSEQVVRRAGNLKSYGRIALLGLAGAAAVAAFTRPAAAQEPQGGSREDGIASSPLEHQKRVEKTVRQQPLSQRVRIFVSGTDPGGLGHEELASSVHGVLGEFFSKSMEHTTSFSDDRKPINKLYIDQLVSETARKPNHSRVRGAV